MLRRRLPVRTLGGTAVGLTAALLLTGCSVLSADPQEPAGESTPSPSASSSAAPSASAHTEGAHTAVFGVAGSATSPADAGIQLEALIGAHSVLVADMMRARIRGDDDLTESANNALTRNTEDMGTLLGPVIGTEAGKSFAKLWAEHITYFFAYARGLSDEDDAARRKAAADLRHHEAMLGEFFSAGSKGRLPEPAAAAAVKTHVDHLLRGADAYAAGNYERSARLYRTSYAHSFALGGALAGALLPAGTDKTLQRPGWKLRSTLTQLLGEHVSLVVAAMRSSVGERSDFAAMGRALNGNTEDLAGAIDSLFGARAARGFQQQWGDHVDALMAYTRATVDKDSTGQDAARETLRTFEDVFSSFLSTATENRLPKATLAQSYVMHDRMLTAEIDAYASGDYQQAHELADQTYDEMYSVAATLANGIGRTLAGDLPRGGSQTGGGGTAPHAGH